MFIIFRICFIIIISVYCGHRGLCLKINNEQDYSVRIIGHGREVESICEVRFRLPPSPKGFDSTNRLDEDMR